MYRLSSRLSPLTWSHRRLEAVDDGAERALRRLSHAQKSAGADNLGRGGLRPALLQYGFAGCGAERRTSLGGALRSSILQHVHCVGAACDGSA
eukprot:7222901-Prymnesium_polylepis.1